MSHEPASAPDVRVVIPTHQRADSLMRLLRALAASTTAPERFEVVIVADGCSDQTAPRVREFRAPFGLELRELSPARSAAAARNLGAQGARARLLLFVDDDMEPSPHMLEAHLCAHDAQAGPLALVGAPLPMRARDASFDELAVWSWWEDQFAELERAGHRFRYEQTFGGVLSLDAKHFRALGGFDESLACREDPELGYRWLASGAQVVFSREAGALHHELRDAAQLLRRKRAEGQADVQLARRHPELWPALRLATAQDLRGAAAYLQRLALFSPRASDMLGRALGVALAPLEALRWRGTWRAVQGAAMHGAYWEGVARALPSARALRALARECAERAAAPSAGLAIDLREGLDASEARLDRERPAAARLQFGALEIGELPARPGAERLRGAHLRPALAGELLAPLVNVLAVRALQDDPAARAFAKPSIPALAEPAPLGSPISVVIPASDAEATLAETLASLRAQTFELWEAIVVDDGSRDATARIAERAAARDPRFRVLRQRNRGEGAARNAGIAASRHAWLLFLDSDDLLLPGALEQLARTAAARGTADAVHGRWHRLTSAGERLALEHCPDEVDLFARFARACAFPVHACLVRRELALRAGPFDETLKTCADWDFWQRAARLGARFAACPHPVALYRMRLASAGTQSERLLRDGLAQIECGHSVDSRLPAARAGLPREELAEARLLFAAWVAGLRCVRGEELESVLHAVPEEPAAGLNAADVAENLFRAACIATARGTDVWDELWPATSPRIESFLTALEARSGAALFARRTLRALEQLALGGSRAARPLLRGASYAVAVDVNAPLAPIALPRGAERLQVRVRAGERELGDLMLPVERETLDVAALADGIAARLAWRLLGEWFERTCYGELALQREPGSIAVRRRGVALAAPISQSAAIDAEQRHDAVGWTVFLQELWGRPESDAGALYELGPLGGALPAEPARALEVTELLADVRTDTPLTFALTVGGASVGSLCVAPENGVITAQRLIGQANASFGESLCRVAVREALLAAGPSRALRERLAAAARTRASTRFAPHARLPLGEARARLDELAARAREGRAFDRHHFEAVFARATDPWSYETAYESLKYEQTLALVPHGAGRVLELACAEGRFTRLLAPRAQQLLASDVSEIALARARAGCTAHDNVSFAALDLFADVLPAPFDVIVCSEVLYYARDENALRSLAAKLVDALAPGGALVLAHTHVARDDAAETGLAWEVPFGAKRIGQILSETPRLRFDEEHRSQLYRVQRFVRDDASPGGAQLPARTLEIACEAPAPHVAARFRRGQGERLSAGPPTIPATTTRLPILMYHRIAPAGPSANARYRTSPGAFADQLAYLRDAGFTAVCLRDWRAAREQQRPLPGRCVLLTFDDATVDFAEHAFPLLQRFGFPASVFVVTEFVGRTNAWDAAISEPVPLLGWQTIRELASAGVAFGSHAATHRPLTGLVPRELRHELTRSKAALERELGGVIDVLAYPHGDFDAAVEHATEAAGYQVGLSCRPGLSTLREPAFALSRVEITGADTLATFVAKLGA